VRGAGRHEVSLRSSREAVMPDESLFVHARHAERSARIRNAWHIAKQSRSEEKERSMFQKRCCFTSIRMLQTKALVSLFSRCLNDRL
jgi:hypothetical protein